MNKSLSATLTVLAILALAGIIFFAGSMYGRVNAFGLSMTLAPGAHMPWRAVPGSAGVNGYRWNNDNAYSPGGMMGNGRGPSMMQGYGRNNANGYGYNNANLTPLTVDQAKAAAEKYLANINNSDLQIAEVMIFDNNAYAIVTETSTGMGAFELLVDPVSQIAYPEHGPNMMWNLKYTGINHNNMTLAPGASAGVGGNGYGMMSGGMMRGYGWDSTTPLDVTSEMTITPEQAITYAQQYLDANISGATAATDPFQFYGYYSLDFEKDGKVAGMLSVNGYSGQVFLHTWHGTFIEEAEVQ